MKSEKSLGITQELLEKSHQRIIDSYMRANLPLEACNYIDKEFVGGDCAICKKPFKKVDVDNRNGKFIYYTPSCRCYPKCPGVHIDSTAKTKSMHIKCGCDFPIEFIVFNALRCESCQHLTEYYRDKAEGPKQPDMSRYRK